MPERRLRKSSAPVPIPSELTLRVAVFHRSDDVEQHVAALRPIQGLRLELVRIGSTWTTPPETSAVLWELDLEDGAHRRVTSVIDALPAVSYSRSASPGLDELSAAL